MCRRDRALDAIERKLGAEKFGTIYKSITVDNGTEFAMADEIERSCLIDGQRTKVYYCHPYSSWERGSNENVNGMIRRKHPKGTDFSDVYKRQGVTLLIVLVACHLDTVMGSNFIRDAVVIAFIANETLSIIENAGLMGIPIPKALTGAIEILKQKSEQDSKEN